MKQVLVSALCLTAIAFAADQKLGQPLTAGEPISVAALLEKPAPLVGKTVQVKGKITEVCEAMGCWMNLTDGANHMVRIQVADGGDIVFPKDSIGKTAIAEGKLEKLEMTREQAIAAAREEAQETHRKFDASKIKSGKTVYQIAGSGAVILQ
jgi:hypothetical protein